MRTTEELRYYSEGTGGLGGSLNCLDVWLRGTAHRQDAEPSRLGSCATDIITDSKLNTKAPFEDRAHILLIFVSTPPNNY